MLVEVRVDVLLSLDRKLTTNGAELLVTIISIHMHFQYSLWRANPESTRFATSVQSPTTRNASIP